jgi:hypothetical protein
VSKRDGSDSGVSGWSRRDRRVLWGAVGAVAVTVVLALGAVAVVGTGGGDTARDAAPLADVPTVTATPTPGVTVVPVIPSLGGTPPPTFSIPPLFGGRTTGPGTAHYEVRVQGAGTAQLITLGVPDVPAVGAQQLPWSKTFNTDSFIVSVTVLAYDGDVSCSIAKNGTVVSEQSAGDGAGPVICSATR